VANSLYQFTLNLPACKVGSSGIVKVEANCYQEAEIKVQHKMPWHDAILIHGPLTCLKTYI
jgi:hypothetical protein